MFFRELIKIEIFKKKINKIIFICFFLFLLYSIYFIFNTSFFQDYSNSAFFGGDTWEYQSMAVNLLNGKSLSFGGYLDFKEYKFESIEDELNSQIYKDFNYYQNTPQKINAYRAPIYPVFLATVYKIFGVNPVIVKIIHLIMIIFVSSSAPFLGYIYWQERGVIIGFFAGIDFLIKTEKFAKEILTEPFLIFCLFLIILSFTFFDNSKTKLNAFILGTILCISFLTKGSLWFIPIFIILYYLYKIIIKKQKEIFKPLLIIVVVFLLPVILYSVYVSIDNEKFILVSTQGERVLLDGNNEFSIKSGTWIPEDTTNPHSIYYKNTNGCIIIKLIKFYINHLYEIPSIIYRKIIAGFGYMTNLKLLIFLLGILIWKEIVIKIEKLIKNINKELKLVFNIILISVFFALFTSPVLQFVNYDNVLILALITIFIYLLLIISQKKKNIIHIPIIFYIIFFNFFIITILTFGLERFTIVIELYIAMVCFYFLLELMEEILKINLSKEDAQ